MYQNYLKMNEKSNSNKFFISLWLKTPICIENQVSENKIYINEFSIEIFILAYLNSFYHDSIRPTTFEMLEWFDKTGH